MIHNAKNKVLVLTSTFPRWKGDEEPPFVYELCKRLLNLFDCTVLAPHSQGCNKQETMDGIDVIRFQYLPKSLQTLTYNGGILAKLKQNKFRYLQLPFFFISELISTARLLRSNKFSVIHAHWVIPQGFVAILARKLSNTSTPILCTLHGGDLYSLRGTFFDKLKRYILNNSDGITVVSNAMKNDLIKQGIDTNKIKVIPMGVDLIKTFIPNTAIARKPRSILFVGRLVEKKGVKYLIQAMPAVIKEFKDARLYIVGSGTEKNDLIRIATKLDINDKVVFAGNIHNNQLPKLYNEHSIVAFPSITATSGDQEGFGLVLVEALGCECPVVATDLPAVHDIIEHNKTAIIIEQNDSEKLSHAIIKLLNDDTFAEKLGKEGRRFVLKKYDWEQISSKYSTYLNNLIDSTNLKG